MPPCKCRLCAAFSAALGLLLLLLLWCSARTWGLVMEYVAGGNMADYILKTILLSFAANTGTGW